MPFNSDAVVNVHSQKLNFESGGVSTDSIAFELDKEVVYSGIVGTFKAGETLAIQDFVCYDNTANALKLADADAAATVPCMGFVLEAGASGEYVKVLLWGYVRSESLDFGVRATGSVTIAANVADEETVVLNGVTFQFTDDGTVTDSSYIAVDVSGGLTKATAQPALKTAMEGHTATAANFTFSAWAADAMTITASGIDIAATANAVTLTETMAGAGNIVSGATLSGATNGNKLYTSNTAGDHMVAASSTSTEINQVIGQALSMKEMLFKPDNYGLAVP